MSRQRSVQVRPTPLGRGVFALRAIGPAEIVGDVNGRLIDDPDYDSRYCVDVGGGWTLEPRSPFRYLNHCCVPNCQFVYTDQPETQGAPQGPARKLWVETLRAIEPGEELLIDYAWTADAAIPCLCGSELCRGWIVDESELTTLLKTVAIDASEELAMRH